MPRLLPLAGAAVAFGATAAAASDPAAVKRGEYVFHATGGCSCHVEPKATEPGLAGGRAQATPFGTFYSTNITPDPEHGIGRWSADDFRRAMRDGDRPDGANLYPSFPYPAFTHMADGDIDDLYAYVMTLPASPRANQPHDLPFPFSIRMSVTPWKWLFLDRGELAPDPSRPPAWKRGRYLVQAVAHCWVCHTPLNILGGPKHSHELAGSADGPDGKKVPNITPDSHGLGKWDTTDIITYLKSGMTPDGDFAAGLMAEVIDNGYKFLSDDDLSAIATYLQSVPARPE